MVLDIIISLPLLFGLYLGFKKGILRVVIILSFFLLGIFLGFKWIPIISIEIEKLLHVHQLLIPLMAFLIVFVSFIVLGKLLVKIIERFLKFLYLNWLNRLTGSLLGLSTALVMVSTIIWLFNTIELFPPDIKSKSILYSYTEPVAPALYAFVPHLREWFEAFESYFASYMK